MTLNQVIKRIKTLALSHKQLRNFYYGSVGNDTSETEHTTHYPHCSILDQPGTIDNAGNSRTLNYQIFLLDLVHAVEETGDNELDVQSDMLSIAEDLLAQLNWQGWDDWEVNASSPLTLIRDNGKDIKAGVLVTISIRTMLESNVCAIPSELILVTE